MTLIIINDILVLTEIQGGEDVLKDNLPRLLKEYRNESNLTQAEMSKKIGISRGYYSDIEAGRYLPSGKVLDIINKEVPIFFISKNDGNTRS